MDRRGRGASCDGEIVQTLRSPMSNQVQYRGGHSSPLGEFFTEGVRPTISFGRIWQAPLDLRALVQRQRQPSLPTLAGKNLPKSDNSFHGQAVRTSGLHAQTKTTRQMELETHCLRNEQNPETNSKRRRGISNPLQTARWLHD